MQRVGLAGVALAVGCVGGMAFREVVFRARAASGCHELIFEQGGSAAPAPTAPGAP